MFPFHIWDVILPIDFHSIIFSRWWNCTTKQLSMHHMWIYATTLIQDVSKDTAALAKIPTCNLKMTRWHHHLPGLVNIQKTMEKSDFFMGKSAIFYGPFSIAMLNYQRVNRTWSPRRQTPCRCQVEFWACSTPFDPYPLVTTCRSMQSFFWCPESLKEKQLVFSTRAVLFLKSLFFIFSFETQLLVWDDIPLETTKLIHQPRQPRSTKLASKFGVSHCHGWTSEIPCRPTVL